MVSAGLDAGQTTQTTDRMNTQDSHNTLTRPGSAFLPLAPPAIPPRHITRLVFVGDGEVVRERLWPNLTPYAGRLRIGVCGLASRSRLDTIAHHYYPILEGKTLPGDELDEDGFSGPHTLYYVGTPSRYHVGYASQAATLGARVACEKPIAHCARAAHLLRPLCGRGQVLGLDHFHYKAGAQAFFSALDTSPDLLARLHRIEFIFHEMPGFALDRHQEDTIADVQYHGFSLALAVLKRLGGAEHLHFEQVAVATHRPDPAWQYAVPRVTTASRILGEAGLSGGRAVRLDLRQAKGAPASLKRLSLLDHGARSLLDGDLSESGSEAHGRMLAELLQPQACLPLDLRDHVQLAECVDQARAAARDHGFHNFARLPDFLPDR